MRQRPEARKGRPKASRPLGKARLEHRAVHLFGEQLDNWRGKRADRAGEIAGSRLVCSRTGPQQHCLVVDIVTMGDRLVYRIHAI